MGAALVTRVGDLEIDQDVEFQEREWVVQRVAWVVMLVIIVAGLSGLFGAGPLSAATAGESDDPLAVEYQRFVRHDGRTTVTVRVGGGQSAEDQVEVWVATDYLDGFEIRGVSPEPEEVRSEGGGLIYEFAVGDPTQRVEVTFSLQPRRMGRLTGEIGVPGGQTVTFGQLSYP